MKFYYYYTLEYRDGINYVSVPELIGEKFCDSPSNFEIIGGEEYPQCECLDPAYTYDWEFSPEQYRIFSNVAIEKFVESDNGKTRAPVTKKEAECITAEIIRRFLGLDHFNLTDNRTIADLWNLLFSGEIGRNKAAKPEQTAIDEKTDPILGKLQNRENARTFSQEYFDEELADWGDGISSSGKEPVTVHITERGNKISCDSRDEAAVLEDLKKHHVVKDVRGQSLEISYKNAFNTWRPYHPDIAVLTHENKIAIIEVKSLTAMSYHVNMEKYKGLEAYCKEKGFMYGMIALSSQNVASPQNAQYTSQKYTSYEELRDMGMKCADEFRKIFEECDQAEECLWTTEPFTKDQVNECYKAHGNELTKGSFELKVHSLILYHEWYNRFENGFFVYKVPVKFDDDD